jgi:hypothetical protein
LQAGFGVVVLLVGLRSEKAHVEILHRFQVADVEGGVAELHCVSFAKYAPFCGAAPIAIVMSR